MPIDKTIRLQSIDMVFSCRITPQTESVIQALGKRLEGRPDSGTIVDTALLPENEKAPYYLSAHIDRYSPELSAAIGVEGPRFFFHARYIRKPTPTPPAELAARRKSGRTTSVFESAVAELVRLSSEEKLLTVVTTSLYVKHQGKPKPAIVGLPIAYGDVGLELVGAEYAVPPPAKYRSGVQRFRYTIEDKNRLFVEFGYSTRVESRFRPWQNERRRCTRLVDELLR